MPNPRQRRSATPQQRESAARIVRGEAEVGTGGDKIFKLAATKMQRAFVEGRAGSQILAAGLRELVPARMLDAGSLNQLIGQMYSPAELAEVELMPPTAIRRGLLDKLRGAAGSEAPGAGGELPPAQKVLGSLYRKAIMDDGWTVEQVDKAFVNGRVPGASGKLSEAIDEPNIDFGTTEKTMRQLTEKERSLAYDTAYWMAKNEALKKSKSTAKPGSAEEFLQKTTGGPDTSAIAFPATRPVRVEQGRTQDLNALIGVMGGANDPGFAPGKGVSIKGKSLTKAQRDAYTKQSKARNEELTALVGGAKLNERRALAEALGNRPDKYGVGMQAQAYLEAVRQGQIAQTLAAPLSSLTQSQAASVSPEFGRRQQDIMERYRQQMDEGPAPALSERGLRILPSEEAALMQGILPETVQSAVGMRPDVQRRLKSLVDAQKLAATPYERQHFSQLERSMQPEAIKYVAGVGKERGRPPAPLQEDPKELVASLLAAFAGTTPDEASVPVPIETYGLTKGARTVRDPVALAALAEQQGVPVSSLFAEHLGSGLVDEPPPMSEKMPPAPAPKPEPGIVSTPAPKPMLKAPKPKPRTPKGKGASKMLPVVLLLGTLLGSMMSGEA